MLACVLWLSSCAETDPYKRLEPAPTPEMSVKEAWQAYDARWPEAFKSVQTVTIDFGPQTRTLVGYLVVQRPHRFRLQGMTEQGVKLFDIAGREEGEDTFSAAEEIDARALRNIARDIRRVFLDPWQVAPPENWNLAGSVNSQGDARRARLAGKYHDLNFLLIGAPPRVDRYWVDDRSRTLFRVDQYEWKQLAAELRPSVIVLRESGVQSGGPAYRLTIQITDFTVRDKPWPAKTFELPE